jgi:hypothetical protein
MPEREFMKEIVMHVAAMIGICLVLGIVGIVSTKYLGPDNPVEEEVEELIEDEVEIALKLPPESLHGKIDLTPKSNQDK